MPPRERPRWRPSPKVGGGREYVTFRWCRRHRTTVNYCGLSPLGFHAALGHLVLDQSTTGFDPQQTSGVQRHRIVVRPPPIGAELRRAAARILCTRAALRRNAKVVEGTAETVALPAPDVVPGGPNKVMDAADTAVSARERKPRKRKRHHQRVADLTVWASRREARRAADLLTTIGTRVTGAVITRQ